MPISIFSRGEIMDFPVIKGAAYVLAHTPHFIVENGTTQTVERAKNNESEYLNQIHNHLRSFKEVVEYPPNQVFVGNSRPSDLENREKPWFDHEDDEASRFGKYGEIIPENEFYGLLKIVDSFDLVMLENNFTKLVKRSISDHPVLGERDLQKMGDGYPLESIEKAVRQDEAEELCFEGQLVGCILRAHQFDINLSAHVMTENLAAKASSFLAVEHVLRQTKTKADEIDYIIEASEEACGDMNQRGGGNFAKAIGESAGCVNATGADTRAFCAGPAHAIIQASALVSAGIFDNILVVGGGAVAKLGMNGKKHVAKKLPLLEDVIGSFAMLISSNDGIHPVIRTDAIGRHKIGSGSSPQQVMTALVTDPLDKAGYLIKDIDKFSAEMQNPEITEPAGAGNVPKSNYKMIGALAVKRGELSKGDLDMFVSEHGLPGFAPTQGHIPSGVPFVGFAKDMILQDQIKRAMIIGKGSLFLARMTNQFDGISFIMEKNAGLVEKSKGLDEEQIRETVGKILRATAARLLEGDDD